MTCLAVLLALAIYLTVLWSRHCAQARFLIRVHPAEIAEPAIYLQGRRAVDHTFRALAVASWVQFSALVAELTILP